MLKRASGFVFPKPDNQQQSAKVEPDAERVRLSLVPAKIGEESTPVESRQTTTPPPAETPSPVAALSFAAPPWLAGIRDKLLDSDGQLTIAGLEKLARHWIKNRRSERGCSERTLGSYFDSVRYLLWFLEQRGVCKCSEEELHQFFEYLKIGHNLPGGRWGNPGETEPLSPRSQFIHYSNLRALLRWAVKKEYLPASPLERIPPPRFKRKRVQPFTREHIIKLLDAANQTVQAKRDYALILFLLDTGLRADELCRMVIGDVDWENNTAFVRHGKGDKERVVVFSQVTSDAAWDYLREEDRYLDDPLFAGQRGVGAGRALTPRGLQKLFERLNKIAGIEDVRVSPHTMRHAFASMYIMNNGSPEELQRLLGHATNYMTQQYVELHDEFLQEQHRNASPVANLLKPQRKQLLKRRRRINAICSLV